MFDKGEPKFEFDGFQFGGAAPDVIVEQWDRGEGGVRDQDALTPGNATFMVGTDIAVPPVWTFELVTNVDGIDAAMGIVEEMGTLWRSSAWRKPGVVGELKYRIGSDSRVVLGRPRRFTPPNADVVGLHGAARFMCDFQLTDSRSFSDAESEVSLSLVPVSSGGIIFPLKFPVTTTVTGGIRAGFVENRGTAPAQVMVTFRGPVKNPRVYTDEWEVGVSGNLAYDESVTVDALALSVVNQSGASVGGRLTRGTRLRDAALVPGQSEIRFTGGDSTGTATATVSWRDASYGI